LFSFFANVVIEAAGARMLIQGFPDPCLFIFGLALGCKFAA
jgi:hypothetical protein